MENSKSKFLSSLNIFKKTIDRQTLITYFRSNEINLWQNFGIYCYDLSIILPPATSVSLFAGTFQNNYLKPTLDLQKGIFAPPEYTGMYTTVFLPFRFYTSESFKFISATFKDTLGNNVAQVYSNNSLFTFNES